MYNGNANFNSFLCVCVNKESTGLTNDIYLNSFIKNRNNNLLPYLWVMQEDNLIAISISNSPQMLHKNTTTDFRDIKIWIVCNKELLLQHWHGKITDKEILNYLKEKRI